MDTIPLAAPAASARHAVRFEGTTSEYFKIWIVNLGLTIVTLGIFSAWAKVRSKRYLYGNTFIGAHAFDYHAQPLRILLGRAIALLLLLGYSLTSTFARPFAALWLLLFAVVFPGLVAASLRFSARNTSYRNVRFDFQGTYGGAFKAFVLWQIWAIVTLFIAYPFARRARDYYNINNHRFGPMSFATEFPTGPLYLAYLAGLGLFLCFTIGGGLLGYGFSWLALKPALSIVTAVEIPAYVLGFLTAAAFVSTRTFNLALSNTRLGSEFRFESQLAPGQIVWITLSNMVAVLCSLGLLYPWARIRLTRYRASCIAVIGPAELGDFVTNPLGSGSAVGEEIASFFDIDLGL